MEIEKYIEENQIGMEGHDYLVAYKSHRFWIFRGDAPPRNPEFIKKLETPLFPISRALLVMMGADFRSPLVGLPIMTVSWSKHISKDEANSIRASSESLKEANPHFQYDKRRRATTGFDLESAPKRSSYDPRLRDQWDGSGMGHTL